MYILHNNTCYILLLQIMFPALLWTLTAEMIIQKLMLICLLLSFLQNYIVRDKNNNTNNFNGKSWYTEYIEP